MFKPVLNNLAFLSPPRLQEPGLPVLLFAELEELRHLVLSKPGRDGRSGQAQAHDSGGAQKKRQVSL